MGMEDDALKQSIDNHENDGNKAEILKIKEDASLEFNGDVEGYAQRALDRINEKSEQIAQPVPQVGEKEKQVTGLGGSVEGLQEKVSKTDEEIKEVDHRVAEVTIDAESQIGEVKSTGEVSTNANQTESLDFTQSTEVPVEKQAENAISNEEKINKSIQEAIIRIEESQKVSSQIGFDSDSAKKLGLNSISVEDISKLDTAKKTEVLDCVINKVDFKATQTPEILTALSRDQLKELNQKRGFIHSIDTVTGADILGKVAYTEQWNTIKKSSENFVRNLPAISENLQMKKSLFGIKYAEMFSKVNDGKMDVGVLRENLSSVMKVPDDMVKLKSSVGNYVNESGIIGLASMMGGKTGLLDALSSQVLKANVFKEKSLFAVLSESKKNLKSFVDSKDQNNINGLLDIYVGMKNKGLLSEEEFKKLTVIS
jgi:phage shock protein A